MSEITLGGDRLGSGKKEKVYLHGYERSTHDLSFAWRSSMSAGTLVPFLSMPALPGDTIDIDLDCDVKTLPTIGPLFGSYKVQLDVFQIPIRLYNGKLHMNMLNIGMNMEEVGLPQLQLKATSNDKKRYGNNEQVNPSSILKYLGISGIGRLPEENGYVGDRLFNAVPYLAYADIYKNYFSNKQEEIGAVIHTIARPESGWTLGAVEFTSVDGTEDIGPGINPFTLVRLKGYNGRLDIYADYKVRPEEVSFNTNPGDGTLKVVQLTEIFREFEWDQSGLILKCTNPIPAGLEIYGYNFTQLDIPEIVTFKLRNIDTMRETILKNVDLITPVVLNENSIKPYGLIFENDGLNYSIKKTQEGLFLKTYQSDLFNNWISTEWLDGDNGVNSITAVDTSSGEFTIDALVLSRKVYDMLNRIAISGGTYDDWLDAVYANERTRSIENPVYMGGLSKELAFQEVINTSASSFDGKQQPLGELAGRGVLTQKHKGGKVTIKTDEMSWIIGLVSITPRIDYSQGNDHFMNLKTMNDFFKPQLQQIAFQDLITDQMAWWDTEITDQGEFIYKSAGKQPAWINYMTNYNRCFGNFAIEVGEGDSTGGQMYMTLNRKYESDLEGNIKDLTTYIDPLKFNQIFADTRLDAQNFWVQIGSDIKARRKMSAKVMPNL